MFHERCLLEWFKSQADVYLANAREYRGQDLTAADAPAECPQCRSECFADPESGEPALHRLFINWGDEEALSSQVSTPTSAGPGTALDPADRVRHPAHRPRCAWSLDNRLAALRR